jgi:ABC-type Mn2+/Zn2+ transport system permease subunit
MAAIQIAPNVRAAMWIAAIFGAIAGGAGYVAAFLYTWPVGASQTAVAAALVAIAAIVRVVVGRR